MYSRSAHGSGSPNQIWTLPASFPTTPLTFDRIYEHRSASAVEDDDITSIKNYNRLFAFFITLLTHGRPIVGSWRPNTLILLTSSSSSLQFTVMLSNCCFTFLKLITISFYLSALKDYCQGHALQAFVIVYILLKYNK
jgi:hypothetical protein